MLEDRLLNDSDEAITKYSFKIYGVSKYCLTAYQLEIIDKFIASTLLMSPENRDKCADEIISPSWKITYTSEYLNKSVEVSSSGLVIRDPISKELYDIKEAENGYQYIKIQPLDLSKKTIPCMVHQLVAKAFVPNDDPEHKTVVHHLNKLRNCNFPWNLKWVSYAEHCSFHEEERPRGEKNGNTKYSDDDIREVCDLRMNMPELTFEEIEAMTGVSWRKIRDICEKRTRLDITAKYNFPPRKSQARGENSGNCKYSDNQIVNVCEILMKHPDWSYPMIQRMTGVDKQTVGYIYRKEFRKDIVSKYQFPIRDPNINKASHGESNGNCKYSVSKVERVCQLLDQVYLGQIKMSHKEIAKVCDVDKNLVARINSGLSWKNVAANHVFYNARFTSVGRE